MTVENNYSETPAQ